jgi:chaperonin GroEL
MQTNDKVGDGPTTAMVLAQAILNKGLENMGDGTDLIRDHAQNPIQLKREIDAECATVVGHLTKGAKQIKSIEDLRKVARVSAENETPALAVGDTFFGQGGSNNS